MAKTVIRQPHIAEVRARSWAGPFQVFGWLCGTGTGFFPCAMVLPCQYVPPVLHTHHHPHGGLAGTNGRSFLKSSGLEGIEVLHIKVLYRPHSVNLTNLKEFVVRRV